MSTYTEPWANVKSFQCVINYMNVSNSIGEQLPMNDTENENKLIKEELCIEKSPDSCGLVILGASGDLTQRKLIPSLYHLYSNKLLPKNFYVVGMARTKMSDDSFRSKVRESLDKHARYGPMRL